MTFDIPYEKSSGIAKLARLVCLLCPIWGPFLGWARFAAAIIWTRTASTWLIVLALGLMAAGPFPFATEFLRTLLIPPVVVVLATLSRLFRGREEGVVVI